MGTERNQVYSLDTYERQRVIQAHKGSVLGLCLSDDQQLLFSSATDPIVNVQSPPSPTMYARANLLGLVHHRLPPSLCPLVTLRHRRHLLRRVFVLAPHRLSRRPEHEHPMVRPEGEG